MQGTLICLGFENLNLNLVISHRILCVCVMYIELQCGTLADTQEKEGTYAQQPEMRRILVPELPSNHVYCLYHMESL